jgi:cyclohexyl-isocyanide hydratase
MANSGELNVAFLLFPNLTQLDLTGPAQVLSRMPGTKIQLVASTLEPVQTDSGFFLLPTDTFDEVPECDILCIPGGAGDQDAMEDSNTIHWVAKVGDSAAWVTSVCTGALILGAAGLLRGYRATTHWSAIDDLGLFGATPVRQRVVFDRNRVTGGGVTAGIDFALTLADVLCGKEIAELIQLSLEYDPAPPFDCGSPDKAGEITVAAYHSLTSRRGAQRLARRHTLARKLGYA